MTRRSLVFGIALCLCLSFATWANPELNNLVTGGTQEPPNLCPWEGYAIAKAEVLGLLNIALTYFDYDGVLHPGLATEIPTEENGRLKLFRDTNGKVVRQEVLWTIREDAYWSDGRPITSDDAVFTFKVQNTPEIPVTSRAFSNLVEEVRKVDEKSFWIIYNGPNLFYAYTVGSIGLCIWFDIAPKHVWEPIYDQVMEQIRANPENAQAIIEGQFLGAPPSTGTGTVVGSGAFQFEEWQINQFLRVRRRGDFFLDPPGPMENYIQEVTYRFIVSQPTLVSAILAGEIDASDGIGLMGLDPAILAAQLGDRGTVEVVADGWMEKLNCNLFPQCTAVDDLLLGDKRTRQALIQAIDRADLASTVYPGATASNSFVVPGDVGYNDALNPWPYDPAAASVLLADLGWSDLDEDGWLERETTDGRTIEFAMHWVATTADFRLRTGEILQEFFADVGIKLEVENLPGSVVFAGGYINGGSECAWRGLFEYANLGGIAMAPADPLSSELWANDLLEDPVDVFLENVPRAENSFAGQNMTGWVNETFDQLRADALQEFDIVKRSEIVKQMQVIFNEELPYIPLYNQVSNVISTTGLVNYVKKTPLVRLQIWNCWEWGWEQNGAIGVR